MRMLRFGRTNLDVPAVGLGTWGQGGPRVAGDTSVGWSGNDDASATAALTCAFDAGITHWDTADVYGDGHSERLIGAMWRTIPREKIFLATKVGWDPGDYPHFYHPDQIRKQMEASLRNLKTGYVDLYYLHHCDFGPNDEYFDDAIALVRRFRDEGKIRFVGLSDWSNAKIMKIIDRADPDVVQPYRNVVDDTYESSGLRAWVENHDLGVAFFSPIKHGLLLGKYDQPVSFPKGDFRQNVDGFGDRATIERMMRAREKVTGHFHGHREPVLHALIGALLADAPTGCVLLGQRTPAHVDSAATVGEVLSPEDATWVKRLYLG